MTWVHNEHLIQERQVEGREGGNPPIELTFKINNRKNIK